ncbi:hypothetical protein B0A55_08174 [Friedmanniomyces simplex]|uniref:SAP domain-containing protein n=1 Tax=Friedmanniomyces simplex TaxID=329884 RepID=A0A4U0X066_9PEZI|nr:hypothetical protein B0A55_08174 [Friedmanniomyces simplex]
MTGPATYASPVLTNERPVLNLPRDIASLRAECKKRKIEVSGSQQDLISRLNAHELVNSRAFSTAVEQSKRPTAESANTPKPVRRFNTSRSLKAVGDTSTIDFAFFPEPEYEIPDGMGQVRVPIIATNYSAPKPVEAEPVVMKAEISSMSLDAVYLPMADSHDGHGLNVDFHAMADKVAANIKKLQVPVEEQAGLMKQIWNDMVDDIVGAKKTTRA